MDTRDDCLYERMINTKGKQDTFTCLIIHELLYLCIQDDAILRFVYDTLPPTYQHAHMTDWFKLYIMEQAKHIEKMTAVNPSMSYMYRRRI